MSLLFDRGLRLPEHDYYPELQAKSGIALHHTVCGSARTTVDLWRSDPTERPRRVATAFVVDPDGTIYEIFDPAAWAWQFGLSWPRALRIPFEQRFIGIEITSEGGLTEHQGKLYAYGEISSFFERRASEAVDAGTPYRGYRWFARYQLAQIVAVARLVDELCARFRIPRVYPAQPYVYYGDALATFKGVIGHAMVRPDKSDPAPDARLWTTLQEVAGLRPTRTSPSELATLRSTPLTDPELNALFQLNTQRLDRMPVAAGSMVKALLQELVRRDVYLDLETPLPDAHTVTYEVIQGDAGQVAPLARALGFKQVTDRVLEVRHA